MAWVPRRTQALRTFFIEVIYMLGRLWCLAWLLPSRVFHRSRLCLGVVCCALHASEKCFTCVDTSRVILLGTKIRRFPHTSV